MRVGRSTLELARINYDTLALCLFRNARFQSAKPSPPFSANFARSSPLRVLLTNLQRHEGRCFRKITNSLVADDANDAETTRMD